MGSAKELKPGSKLLTKGGRLVGVESIGHREGSFTVYNIEVERLHSYYVSELGLLVHNQCQAEKIRKLWAITEGGTDAAAFSERFGSFYRHESTGLWWSKDTAGHGESVWKVFKETKRGLEWMADANKYGDFIVGKYKGPTGRFIPWKELSGK